MTFQFKTLSLTIGLAVGSVTIPALAVPVTVLVDGNTSVSESGNPAITSSAPAGTSVYLWNQPTGPSFAEAIGNNSGYSNVASYSNKNVSAVTSQLHESATVTNNTGAAQNFTFNFFINAGSLTTSNSVGFSAAESLFAGYDLNILVNGSSIWKSAATLTTDANGSNIAKSGANLNAGVTSGSNYYWNSFSDVLSLGNFQDNETFTLDYFLTTTTTNNFTTLITHHCSTSNYGYGYGDGYDSDSIEYCYDTEDGGNAYARIGDPNDINYTHIDNNSITTTTSVAEPSSLLLVGAGLAGLAFRRRAKKSA